MKSITVYIAKLLVLLIMIILGFFQNIGVFCLYTRLKKYFIPCSHALLFFCVFPSAMGDIFFKQQQKMGRHRKI